jgi:ABC-type cobalt transport system substrate-binding protein
MYKKLGLAMIVAAALVVVSVTFASASTSGSSAGSDDHATQVIKLIATGVKETTIDLGHPGFSAGDQEIVALDLSRDGTKVGTGGSICQFVITTTSSASDLCQLALSLPDGQITAQGLVASTPAGPGTYFLAITGGTGSYRTAHGQVKITATTTNRVPFTLYVIR